MSSNIEKCVDFTSRLEQLQENGMVMPHSTLRESIHNVFLLISYGFDETSDYPFHVYSTIYNLHTLAYGNNGRFDWFFLPEAHKVELLESTNLNDSLAAVSKDLADIKDGFGQFPVSYQMHPFHEYKCPQEIQKCYNDVRYSLAIGSELAMEEVLFSTYKLSGVMRNDLDELLKNECFGKQLMQAYYQDVTTKGKLVCSEIYSYAAMKASNDPTLEAARDTIDAACQVFDSVPTIFDEQYNCVLRPSGCVLAQEVGVEG